METKSGLWEAHGSSEGEVAARTGCLVLPSAKTGVVGKGRQRNGAGYVARGRMQERLSPISLSLSGPRVSSRPFHERAFSRMRLAWPLSCCSFGDDRRGRVAQ
eukprot:2026493-Pleurochrysis_carterae.AAC.3